MLLFFREYVSEEEQRESECWGEKNKRVRLIVKPFPLSHLLNHYHSLSTHCGAREMAKEWGETMISGPRVGCEREVRE